MKNYYDRMRKRRRFPWKCILRRLWSKRPWNKMPDKFESWNRPRHFEVRGPEYLVGSIRYHDYTCADCGAVSKGWRAVDSPEVAEMVIDAFAK